MKIGFNPNLSYYREKVARACGIPSRHLRLCCKMRLFSDTQKEGLLAIPSNLVDQLLCLTKGRLV